MAHTRKAAILIIDELQEKLKDQDIALAKRLEWIRKVEARNADLLAALKALRPLFECGAAEEYAVEIEAAEAAIERAS